MKNKKFGNNGLVISAVVSLVMLFAFFGVYAQSFYKSYKEELYSSLKRQVTYVDTTIREQIEQIINTSQNAGYMTAVQRTLFSGDPSERVESIPIAREVLASAKDESDIIVDLFYYADSGHLYTVSEYYNSFHESLKSYGFDRGASLDHSFIAKKPIIDGKYTYFLLYTPIYRTAIGIAHKNRTMGVCACLFSFKNLLNSSDEVLGREYAEYIIYEDRIVSSNNAFEDIDEETIVSLGDGEQYRTINKQKFYSYSELTGDWKIVSVSKGSRNFWVEIVRDKTIYLSITMCIALFTIMMFFFGRQENLRLQELHERKLLTATLAQKDAEMSAYRSQINPHFFFNTLECVRSMAQYYRVDMIEELVTAMSKMFRYSLYSEMIVDFSAEIDVLDQYFLITSYRFPDKYRLVKKIDEGTLHYRVPSMIVQPLLENAIKHAFDQDKPDAVNEITVSACLTEDNLLEIAIQDNGCGMSEEVLKHLIEENLSKEHSFVTKKDSIGIRNIYERIKLFDERNKMIFESKEGEYTKVTLTLYPARMEKH